MLDLCDLVLPSNAGWLGNAPKTHDVPAMNITLASQNFESPNTLTAEQDDNAITGAFVPFNSSTEEGQTIKGELKCTSCILRANLDGTDLQLEGWGLRNPSGLAFNDEGRLFTVVHGADERSSRPIANDSDKFYEINLNDSAVTAPWYGWPDYFGNAEPVTDEKFQSNMSSEPLEFVMQDHPAVEAPLALFQPPHTAVIQMDFGPAADEERFGCPGEAFVAQIGPNVPTPPEQGIVGQNIMRVNINNGTIEEFLTLREPSTSFKPTDVVFHEESGAANMTALYIVDWGNLIPPTIPHTEVVWKIIQTGTSTAVSEGKELANQISTNIQ